METKENPGGWRARKAKQTRERIAEVAVDLFIRHGFDQITLDAIAAAAAISRRTFFHYYPSKEAILEALDDGVHDAFREALGSSAAQSPLQAVHAALRQVIGRYSNQQALVLDRLMHSTEALRARKQANYSRQEQALHAALCEIWPDPGRQTALQIVAMVGIGAMRLAADRWREAPEERQLLTELDWAFDELRGEIALYSSPGPAVKKL